MDKYDVLYYPGRVMITGVDCESGDWDGTDVTLIEDPTSGEILEAADAHPNELEDIHVHYRGIHLNWVKGKREKSLEDRTRTAKW